MKISAKVISVFLAICLLMSSLSIAIYGEPAVPADDEIVANLPFAAISDIHYYPQSYTGNNCDAWKEFCTLESKEYEESDAILRAALDSIKLKAEQTGIKYLFVPGDLTKDSEYEAHVELARILKQFELDTGIQVIVTNGNHDINNQKACTFENGYKESARCITQAEFREVYADLGFDIAYKTYTPPEGSTQGGLSYAVNLDDNYSLIVADTSKYDAVNPGKDETSGMITDDLLTWMTDVAAESIASGRTPMLMMHHSIAPHMKLEPSVTFAFCVDDYLGIAEKLADAGVHYAFTGHLHTNDIASVTSDNGNVIYDSEVGSLSGFPNQIREMEIKTYGSGESDMEYTMLDADYANNITADGVTFDKPFSKASFAINFGGKFSEDGNADATEFFMGIIKSYALPYLDKIKEMGGIDPFLQSMGIDLKSIIGNFLEPYIGTGLKVGNINIFSVDNIMWFIDDLLDQVEELYIDDPENLLALCESVVSKLVNFKVSDVPCTKFINTLNFGDTSKGGTLGDFLLSAMYYWYTGNEDISDDEFINSVIDNFENGTVTNDFINTLLSIISDDLLNDAILSKLEIRLERLFSPKTDYSCMLCTNLSYFKNTIMNNNITYQHLIDVFFSLGALPYTSLYDIVDQLLIKEYVTDSQIESIGAEIAYCASDFITDTNPQQSGDFDVTYSTKAVIPEATTENFRLPTMISATLGENDTSANISWFSKDTVSGGDIEIYKADDFTSFTGTPTDTDNVSFTITENSETVTRSYPGIDFGIIGFFNYEFPMNRHIVTLSNLEAGTKYYYRVGDASKNWWSKTGTIETPDGSGNVTFFHMSDPQSQNKDQYSRAWANIVDKAFEMYPNAKFIMGTGDLVDSGSNNNQWQWLFDTASDNLINTYLMPATGNHEEKTDNATVNNFVLPNVPEQDTANGVYYSFDYNNVHIMVLNTNDLGEDDALSDAQIEWLKADAAASNAQWKIVALHKALYSNGSHYDDDDVMAMRAQLSVLMPQLGIDMVLQGHDHVYMRTYALDSNKVTDTSRVYLNHNGKKYTADVKPTGTTYVISGMSGVKTYLQKDSSLTDKEFPRAEKITVADASMFSAIQIEDGILYFDAYKVDGNNVKNVDSFAIQKDTNQGEYAGDCEDVSAADKNKTKVSFLSFFEKIFNAIIRILNVLSNIAKLF